MQDIIDQITILIIALRAEVKAAGGLGPVPHALNVAATHAQDALGAVYVAQAGGSPGIVAPPPRV